MKKTFTIIAFSAAALTISSCREELSELNLKGEFTGSITSSVETRTSLSGYDIHWNEGDLISINGVTYKASVGNDSTKAGFTKNDSKGNPEAPFTAFYPSTIYNGTTATLPSVQTYGSFSVNPMYAFSENKSLEFKNICGILAVCVTSSDIASVKAIRVSSSNKALSGTFTVTGGKAVLDNPTDVTATVTLDCGETGISTSTEGTTFFIGIPAQTYKNLKVELSEDGASFTKAITTKENQDITVEEGRVYSIGFDKLSIGGYNLFGYVRCGETPLADVVVTDGYEFTTTAADGSYRLKSDKEYGFVEISLPSGYRAPSKGVVPLFFARVKPEKYTLERHDFNLIKDADQTKHTMLFFTDMHLGGSYDDVDNNKVFENDINSYISEHPTENIFAGTMGDNSFDKRWYVYNFFPSTYLANVDSAFSANNLQIFHCIGNHDHEKGKSGAYPAGEKACAQRYKDDIGPTFYSYNIGLLHYICLDNIICTNDGTGDTSYDCKLEPYMLEWLKKDLSYVDKSTPLVIQMHSPVWYRDGNFVDNKDHNKDSLITAFGGRRTYILCGHSHSLYTNDFLDELNVIQLNCGSVCGSWWITQYYNPGMCLNREGSPTGYRIFKADGTDVSWQYKAYGRPITEQMRTYDLNKIDLRAEFWVSDIASKDTTGYGAAVYPYNRAFANNNVFFFVYDEDPKWKIEVYEDGVAKTYKSWNVRDPLHIIAYETEKYDRNVKPSEGVMTTTNSKMYTVKCSKSTSTVTFKVTDRFGNVYTETMARPRPFTIEEYSK